MPLGGTRILCVRRLQSGANDQQRAGSIFLTMRSKAVIVARVLLGLVFFVFGLNGFLHWFPLPTMKGAAAEFMGGLVASGYFFPLPGRKWNRSLPAGMRRPIEWDNVVLYGQYILDRKLVRRCRPPKKGRS